MSPRRTTDVGALFELLVEDLRMELAASVEKNLSDFSRRLARIERRLDQVDPLNAASAEATAASRICSLCDRPAVARGMCSAHYQQWRYRERKNQLVRAGETTTSQAAERADSDPSVCSNLILLPTTGDAAEDN